MLPRLIRIDAPAGAALLAAVVAAVSIAFHCGPARAGEPSRPPTFAERLVGHLARSEADSALSLVTRDRARARGAVEDLLAERARLILAARPDSAGARLEFAREIATHLARAFGDSLGFREVAFHESLAASALPPLVAGWDGLVEVERLYRASDFDGARSRLDGLRDAVRASGDPYLALRAEQDAGNIYFRVGAPDSARATSERAIEAARRLDDPVGANRSLFRLAAVDQFQDRLDAARATLLRVIDEARRLSDAELTVTALRTLGQIAMLRGDLDDAIARIEEALPLALEGKFATVEAGLLADRGSILGQKGEFERAIASLEEGLRVAAAAGPAGVGSRLQAAIYLAVLCGETEQYSRALVVLRDALPVAESSGMAEAQTILREQIGEFYAKLGRHEEALRHYQGVLPAALAQGSPRFEAETLLCIGRAQLALGRPQEAAAAIAEAVSAARRGATRFVVAQALLELGAVHAALGDFERAESDLRGARALADTLGNPLLAGGADCALGAIHAERGEGDRAFASFDEAIGRGRAVRSRSLLREAFAAKARWLRGTGDLAGADALLAEAIESVESVRRGQAGEAVRLGVLSQGRNVYAERVFVLLEMAESNGAGGAQCLEAFRVAERARARALLDALSGAHADPGSHVEPALRSRERALAAHLGMLQTDLSRAVSAEVWSAEIVDSLEGALEETSREYAAVVEEIAARSPILGSASGARAPLGVEDVRERVLLPGQVLLEYVVGDTESALFLVGEGTLHGERITMGSDSLAAAVAVFRHALLDTASHAWRDSAVRLHQLLLGPVLDRIPKEARLVIVPDGPLFGLPFAALSDGNRFLVERHPIVTSPSASLLDAALRGERRARPRRVLAVGNPASFRDEILLSSASAVRGAERWRFGALPHAEEEAKRVARFFKRATLLTGASATEEAVEGAIGASSHVHFATHGLLDEAEPGRSGLALAQDDDPAEDGFFQAHEIRRLRIPAELVVLSACNTGLGRLERGEGVLGLARAFLVAGARALVLTLWEVGDETTLGLVETFYRSHLDRGLPADRALQAAQVEAIRAGLAPRAWAGFALWGSVDATRSPRSREGFATVARAGAGLAAVALGVLGLVARRGRAARRRAAALATPAASARGPRPSA